MPDSGRRDGTTETGTHTFILILLRKHPRGKKGCMRCPIQPVLPYTVFFFFFASLSFPSHTDSHPNLWDWGRRSPTDHSTHHASGLPAPAQCILVGRVSLGGWQLGIEGSFWVDWLTDCPDCSVARPPFPAVSVGSPARERCFFLGWVGLWCVGLQRLASSHLYTHAHTHAGTQARTHTCVCAARLFPTEQMGRRWTAEVWDFPNLGLGTA